MENKIVTPKFRMSFPELFAPKAFDATKEARYSVQMLIEKSVKINELLDSVKACAIDKWGEKVDLKSLALPIKNGDSKNLDSHKGMHVISASTKFQPTIVDAKLNPIMDKDAIYAGCYARAAVSPYAWEHKVKGVIVKKGVSFNLISVQKLGEGERFVKRAEASDFFDKVEDDSTTEDISSAEGDFSFLD